MVILEIAEGSSVVEFRVLLVESDLFVSEVICSLDESVGEHGSLGDEVLDFLVRGGDVVEETFSGGKVVNLEVVVSGRFHG